MCEEYGKAVYIAPVDDDDDNDVVLSILKPTKATKVADCGISATPLIIGGEKAFLKEFPHMVGMLEKNCIWNFKIH